MYSLTISLYYLGILVASLYNKKAKFWVDGRKGVLKRIAETVDPSAQLIWFHASSLGEFEQGRPVIEAIREKHPGYKILLTFFSPSGYEVRKNYRGADYIFYLPLDTRANAAKFVDAISPSMVFFIKYEFWYHYLRVLKKKGIPVYLISAIFRRNQLFFRWYGRWYRKMLKFFNHIFVQNDESLNLLSDFNIKHTSKSGDTRFDRVAEIARQTKAIDIAEKFRNDNTVVICGSTWDKDEELLVKHINNSAKDLKYIIAPHEIHETHLQRIIAALKVPFVLFSDANFENVADKQVLIINNIGMLSSLYKYGDWAYIGGGFGVGIHNILEAATFNLPVVFGPNYHKFKEAVDLVQAGGAFSIEDFNGLSEIFKILFENKEKREYTGKIAGDYVIKNQGATEKILTKIFNAS
ncbi:MAG: 3-deoxy-D-manno-octulosonic acid transferase [Bacteroidales bacterium]|nr:3-deoxy-D-manno-octulosonic acid transferase [Bacteroidales bacterium]